MTRKICRAMFVVGDKDLNAKRKAQLFTWDLVIACIIFTVVISMALYYWLSVKSEMITAEEEYALQKTINDVGERLMRTTGTPADWTEDNVMSIGLAEARFFFGKETMYGRVVDPTKLLNMIYMVDKYYYNTSTPIGKSQTTIRAMFTQGAYHFYINISCVNPITNATMNLSSCFSGAIAKTHSIASTAINCTKGGRFNITLKKEYDHNIPGLANVLIPSNLTFTPKRTMVVGRIGLPDGDTGTSLTIDTCCRGVIAHTLPFDSSKHPEYTSQGIPLNASVIFIKDTPYKFIINGSHKEGGIVPYTDENATIEGTNAGFILYSAEGNITVSNATYCLIGETENIGLDNVTIVVSTTKTCGISTLKIMDFSVVPLKESDSSVMIKFVIWKDR